MKIEIERFGPIKKFSYDLDKDFIVTYGNNNIGKSYSMQIVYLLLKTFIAISGPRAYRGSYAFYPYSLSLDLFGNGLIKLIQEFKDSDESLREITDIIVQNTYKEFSTLFVNEFYNSCQNTFGNLEKTLESDPVIHVEHQSFSFDIFLKGASVKGIIDMKPVRLKKTNSEFHKSKNYPSYLDIYVANDNEEPARLIIKQIQQNLTKWFKSIRSEYEDVYFLPASRSGIYSGMNAFGSIVAELSKNRAYFTKKIEFPGISEPISDYFIALSNIKQKSYDQYMIYYSQIEDKILKGKVTFDKNRNTLMYKPNNVDALFEMTEVSSMVSEISPIVAFLKYILSSQMNKGRFRKSILFIEEPEAHLHPNNQIALVEIFSSLIQGGVKLLMSSHSNYVFNKLNKEFNIEKVIEESEISSKVFLKKRIKKLGIFKVVSAFITPTKVTFGKSRPLLII